MNKPVHNTANTRKPAKKRKYYRRCEICNSRYEQSDMHRTSTGWCCADCRIAEHPEYEIEFED